MTTMPNEITGGADSTSAASGRGVCQVFFAAADVFLIVFLAIFFTGAAALRAASAAAHSLVV